VGVGACVCVRRAEKPTCSLEGRGESPPPFELVRLSVVVSDMLDNFPLSAPSVCSMWETSTPSGRRARVRVRVRVRVRNVDTLWEEGGGQEAKSNVRKKFTKQTSLDLFMQHTHTHTHTPGVSSKLWFSSFCSSTHRSTILPVSSSTSIT